MKNFTLIAIIICLFSFSNIANAQIVNIPDANFKAALVGNASINTNSDSEIQVSEASAYTGTIDVHSKNITDLTGIEAFTALKYLNCSFNQLTNLNLTSNKVLTKLGCYFNQLTNLNLSANTALSILWCNNNQLTNLDLSANTALTDLACGHNQLTSLNLSTNTSLTTLTCYENQLISLNIPPNSSLRYLWCNNNQLTNLNVSANTALKGLNCNYNKLSILNLFADTALTFLECQFNQLKSLNLSTNTAITLLSCSDNQLTSLNLSSNTNIARLYCYNNQLNSLNLSVNTALTDFYCNNNQLPSLNLSLNSELDTLDCSYNQLNSLNVKNGNNIHFSLFKANNNPNLSCIQVDDSTYMNNNWINFIDTIASFSDFCIITIPLAPNNLTLSSQKNILAKMILSWTDNSNNEDGFRIYRSTDDINYVEISTTAANINAYIDSTGAPSTLYYYRVTAFNSAGSSAFSNTTSGTTSDINEISVNNAVSVFPNPTNGKLAVSVSNGNISTIEIYNLIGEKVFTKSFNQEKSTEIDISNSPCGIYFLKVSAGDKVFTSKIVLQ